LRHRAFVRDFFPVLAPPWSFPFFSVACSQVSVGLSCARVFSPLGGRRVFRLGAPVFPDLCRPSAVNSVFPKGSLFHYPLRRAPFTGKIQFPISRRVGIRLPPQAPSFDLLLLFLLLLFFLFFFCRDNQFPRFRGLTNIFSPSSPGSPICRVFFPGARCNLPFLHSAPARSRFGAFFLFERTSYDVGFGFSFRPLPLRGHLTLSCPRGTTSYGISGWLYEPPPAPSTSFLPDRLVRLPLRPLIVGV